jgi:WXXGXW repeat (2 copies)
MSATVRTFSCNRWIIAGVGLPLPTESVHFMKITKDRSGRTLSRAVQGTLLSLILVGGISAGSALARGVVIEIAPPAPQIEVIPTIRPGYTWAPGYWNWQHNQHVWVGGRSIRARRGYDWAPDRWNQVNNRHEFERGHWQRHTEHGQ